MEAKILSVTCPSCGKRYKIKHPGREIVATLNCKACGTSFKVKFGAPAQNPQGQTRVTDPAAAINALPKTHEAQADDPRKTLRPGSEKPLWTVANFQASACLKVTMHQRILPARTKTFTMDGLGKWTIGRYDPERPSDISITGDPSVSRCCASINTHIHDNSNKVTYMFRVDRSSNPIRVNDRAVHNNESIELYSGDRIVMGRTEMVFEIK